MSKEYQVIHKKSNVLTNGQPKLPSASTIEYGEIAINYAKGGETMSIKNANNEIVTFSSDAKILGQIPAVADYFDGAEYDSNSKRINFKHGNTVKAYVDATDFIKDGMVDDVAVTTPTSGGNSGVTCLVVTFNTESGKEDIEIPLSLIFDPSNYYDKDDADEKFLTISAYTEDEEVVAAALNDLNDRIEQIYVPEYTSSLINDSGFITSAYTGFASSAHTHSQYATTAHTHTAAEVGAMATSERSNYATTAHTHTAAEVGAMATSERSNYSTTGHTHSQYATTSHTHTAAEVGAMATSERNNYLTTATTVPTESTISQSGFTKDAITAISINGDSVSVTDGNANIYGVLKAGSTVVQDGVPISAYGGPINFGTLNIINGNTWEWLKRAGSLDNDGLPVSPTSLQDDLDAKASTAHTHTAAEVGAMATSERSNYATTAHTHTAAEVGAMATSERSNYSTTGHTHSQYATTAHTHTAAEVGAMATSERSNYATTAHTHTASEVGAMATSERSNYSTTGHTHSQYATTAHTHTAAEVGAIATSERSNYLTTATTIPTESTIASSGFTKNGLTSADTASVFFAIDGTTTYSEITAARNSGKVIFAKRSNAIYTYVSQTLNVGHVFSRTWVSTNGEVFVNKLVCDSSNQWTDTLFSVPNESDIASSGFTKNGITGINVNGTAATITNGVAEINVQGGGGSTLPSVSAADNGKVLMVVNGAWAAVMPTTVYTGTDTPLSSIGNDGDIYLQTS